MAQNLSLQDWRKYFEDIALDSSVAESYLKYISKFEGQKRPVILDFGHLAALLGRTEGYVASVVNGTERHYRRFVIPKRRGGMRKISAPYPALLECQKWIKAHLLDDIPIHPAAHGFVARKSILSNARKHTGHREMLKIDIQDFFPTISIKRVIGVFRALGYPPNIALFLARFCCLEGRLPQGAATSPALSNVIFYMADVRLSRLAEAFNLTYTRYADDLVFSGDVVPRALIRYLKDILAESGFMIQKDKTRFCEQGHRKIVTGLLVNGDAPRVPSGFRREVARDVYFIKKFGFLSHVAQRKIGDPFYIDRLRGRLIFWKQIEEHNKNVDEMLMVVDGLISRFREPS